MAKEKLIITRKIEIYINHEDAQVRKELRHQWYRWRDSVRCMANTIVTHKFIQENVRQFVYLKDEIKEKFYVKDCLKEGKGMSEQNTTYSVVAQMVKDGVFADVPADIRSCLNQTVANSFKETLNDVRRGKASIRSFKNNIPIPFSGKRVIGSLEVGDDGRYNFVLFKTPWCMKFGRDRSNNQCIVDKCMRGEYKVCGSSITIDDEHKKMFLLLTVEQPIDDNVAKDLDGEKTLFARIGIATPLVYMVDIDAKNDFDSGRKLYTIGTSEYFHRRLVLQKKIRDVQMSLTDTTGGHGRSKKLKALKRFKDAEYEYVKNRMHLYSRMLVDAAVKHRCGRIVLLDQERREEEVKNDTDKFVLRNWGYGGLKGFIGYKCKMAGIDVVED